MIGTGRASGRILVNGKRPDFNTFRKISAYVLQHDIFFAGLTVKETIRFSAELRLPRSMSKEAKEARVEQVSNSCCCGTRVLSAHRR